NVAFIATGAGKADVLERILEQQDQSLPAARVKPLGSEVVWFLDEPAAAKLPSQ
ncbi:MAG: hypothetical protein SGCHY_004849, partial [Lobulomycetales sp.]